MTAHSHARRVPGCSRCDLSKDELGIIRRTDGDAQWFRRTGHCGRCGDPGDFCSCRPSDPCGCADLHPVGSARTDDAIERFAEPVVYADQGDLFGSDT